MTAPAMTRCKHCGQPITNYRGMVWVHGNGFALCDLTDPDSSEWAEPEAEE
ncbi:hypothetical protein SEA_BAUER_53 [Arthrobacter phage Bauer]|uniref:Uncharacterized protein n=1 Tax=Arthrobacter phage Bauer TaxID=2985648 RepID=A0A9E7V2K2_9CAUD|nr:hypothetical protein QEO99_gp53 [Arthrobacter phage Bauer]UYM26602.1 hypothetical protein SEA_BAUER_53 [Arthrobacter phage Bauer]